MVCFWWDHLYLALGWAPLVVSGQGLSGPITLYGTIEEEILGKSKIFDFGISKNDQNWIWLKRSFSVTRWLIGAENFYVRNFQFAYIVGTIIFRLKIFDRKISGLDQNRPFSNFSQSAKCAIKDLRINRQPRLARLRGVPGSAGLRNGKNRLPVVDFVIFSRNGWVKKFLLNGHLVIFHGLYFTFFDPFSKICKFWK